MVAMRNVWIRRKEGWKKGVTTYGEKSKSIQVILRNSDNSCYTVKCKQSKILTQKHNGRTYKSLPTEVIPLYKKLRPPRFYVPVFKMEPVAYRGSHQHGDFAYHLGLYYRHQDLRVGWPPAVYTNTLVIYNENLEQQRDKSDDSPGGGNAVARMKRKEGLSIGVPTGRLGVNGGGFDSLDLILPSNETVKSVIDEAFDEIVEHVLKNPHFHTIYFSEGIPGSGRLGTGIFNPGIDVVDYITDMLHKLPDMVKERAYSNRKKERYI
jgi:hypothetical protein